jgi:hypothetical protein
MHLAKILGLALLLLAFAALLIRDIVRRYLVRYEYRIDSFSVIGPFGRQLFQIRQSEIESLGRLSLMARPADAKHWPRNPFAPRVVIRARMVRRPVVITWEGLPIAGLVPEGLKQRSPKRPKRR